MVGMEGTAQQAQQEAEDDPVWGVFSEIARVAARGADLAEFAETRTGESVEARLGAIRKALALWDLVVSMTAAARRESLLFRQRDEDYAEGIDARVNELQYVVRAAIAEGEQTK